MKRRTAIMIIGLIYLVLTTLTCIAVGTMPIMGDTAGVISKHQALEMLDESERSHQQVIDNPDKYYQLSENCTDNVSMAVKALMGDLAFHADCVREYQEIKKYIKVKGE